jgi:hypothetical protein
MIALDPRQTRNYILEADRELPEDQQTIFKLKDLDEGTLIRLMDSIEVTRGDNGEARISSGGMGTRVYTIVQAGLVGWRNLRDGAGNSIPFHKNEVTNKIDDDLLARLPWTAKMELANAIEAGAKLTEEQEEKSEPSPED